VSEQPDPVVKAQLPQSGPVIALSSADVWATTGAGVLHWDGTRWAFADLPSNVDGAAVKSFAAASPDSIWAVGATTGAGGRVAPLILHWDGKGWSQPDGVPQVGGLLYSVAVAGNDVWAVGGSNAAYNSPPIILHFTAGRWQVVPSPATNALTGLAMTGSSAGWASGPSTSQAKGALLRWNGTAWRPDTAALSGGEYLWALAAAPGNQVWGVGSTHLPGAPFSMHWTGRGWQPALVQWPGQGPDPDLVSVSPIPGGTAWAVGYSGIAKPGGKAVIFHWSGTAWTVAWQLAEPTGYLNGIGVVSATDAWSVGYVCTAIGNDYRCAKNQFLALHWDGRTWNQSWLPASFQPPR
jgi:hypothetical protein